MKSLTSYDFKSVFKIWKQARNRLCFLLFTFLQIPCLQVNNSHLFNYFVTFPVNFPFSCLKSCFSTLIELENETWVTDFCSRPKGVDKRVTKVSFSNELRVEIVFCWYYSWANSKEKFSECNLIFPKLPKLKKRPASKRFLKPRQRRGFGMFTRWPFFQLR